MSYPRLLSAEEWEARANASALQAEAFPASEILNPLPKREPVAAARKLSHVEWLAKKRACDAQEEGFESSEIFKATV